MAGRSVGWKAGVAALRVLVALALVADILAVGLGPPEAQAQTPAAGLVFLTNSITVGEYGGNPDGTGEASYTIKLATEPTHDVEITVTSSDPSAAWTKIGPGTGGEKNTLTFTTTNWNIEQTITARGRNDRIDNPGDQRDVKFNHTSTSTDPNYNNKTFGLVDVTVTDDDTAGMDFSKHPATPKDMNEGDTFDYEVWLTSQPTHDVTVTAAPAYTGRLKFHTGNGTPSDSASLTFTPTSWGSMAKQTVTITAVRDLIDNLGPDRTVIAVHHTAASADTKFDGLSDTEQHVNIRLRDLDTAGVPVTGPGSTNLGEDGDSTTYTVRLRSKPLSAVTIRATSSLPGVAVVGLGDETTGPHVDLEFEPATWDQVQTVTIIGVDDDIDQADDIRAVTVSHAVTVGDGGMYPTTRQIDSVSVNVNDNDTAGVSIGRSQINLSESGSFTFYTVGLRSRPLKNVTVRVKSDTPSAAKVHFGPSGGSGSFNLVFTADENWNQLRSVFVSPVDDNFENFADRTATISHEVTVGDGGKYTTDFQIPPVLVTVTDDEATSRSKFASVGTVQVGALQQQKDQLNRYVRGSGNEKYFARRAVRIRLPNDLQFRGDDYCAFESSSGNSNATNIALDGR